MSDFKYSSMVFEVLKDFAFAEKENLKIYQHLITTDEYLDAHGRFEWECDTGESHETSKDIIRKAIENLDGVHAN